jgi:hypothetical protein
MAFNFKVSPSYFHAQVAAVAKLMKSSDHGLQAVNLGTGKGGSNYLYRSRHALNADMPVVP